MTEHLAECPTNGECSLPDCLHSKPLCICDALRACEARVIAAAVQRVEALLAPLPNTWPSMIRRSAAIDAIKGCS